MFKILIWGLGKRTQEYLSAAYFSSCRIVGFVDSYKAQASFCNAPVFTPEQIGASCADYDYIVVCNCYSHEIYRQCVTLGLDLRKIVFTENEFFADGASFWSQSRCVKRVNALQSMREIEALSPQLAKDLREKQTFATRFNASLTCGLDLVDTQRLVGRRFDQREYLNDYCRYRTFELVANEIIAAKVQGHVAELGVYQGTFAKLIHEKFTDRICYLFDTFDSFQAEEFQEEVEKGRCDPSFRKIFENTSVDDVLSKMESPQRIVIRQGLFPDSTRGLEALQFAFVSIDVDLESSIYAGLQYFYPRLRQGGYIFVHDYNNSFLQGVKAAVDRYQRDTGGGCFDESSPCRRGRNARTCETVRRTTCKQTESVSSFLCTIERRLSTAVCRA